MMSRYTISLQIQSLQAPLFQNLACEIVRYLLHEFSFKKPNYQHKNDRAHYYRPFPQRHPRFNVEMYKGTRKGQ